MKDFVYNKEPFKIKYIFKHVEYDSIKINKLIIIV